MTTLLIIAIYLVGYILAYFLIRKEIKIMFEEWDIRWRLVGLYISIGSWASIVIMVIAIMIRNIDLDKPAKW